MGDSKIAPTEDDDDGMAVDTKIEVVPDDTPSSLESTPEPDNIPGSLNQDPAPPQKRKGGRKPIYATSEERKQRNRQAQAAFRERRTEYIKQLEATIKQNEDSLSSLQQSHRTAADECLMLRYKNSLLERILLEKGIDVNTELQLKTGSPIIGSPFSHLGTGTTPTSNSQTLLQRTAVQRQHARRSVGQQFLPKLAPGQSNADVGFPTSSPQGVPTPSSHASSPTNVPVRSPMTVPHGAMTPPASAVMNQAHQSYATYQRPTPVQQHPAFFASQQHSPNAHRRPTGHVQHQSSASVHSSHSAASHYSMNQHVAVSTSAIPGNASNANTAHPPSASYYPSPFQKHIDQLEQEYDTEQQSMLDQESESSPHQSQRAFPSHFDHPQHQAPNPQQAYYQQALQSGAGANQSHHYATGHRMPSSSGGDLGSESFEPMAPAIDPNDPMLDADPFGLSASMHYPTSYSAVHEQSQPR